MTTTERQRLIDNLMDVAKAYIAVRPIAMSTLGREFFGDGKFFDLIRRPRGNFTIRSYDEGLARLSRGWPEGATWPPHVLRPPIRPSRAQRQETEQTAD